MKILFCAYRNWALNVYNSIRSKCPHVSLVTTTKQFDEITQTNSFDVTILLGWSWIVSDEYVSSNYTIVAHPSDLPNYAGGSPIQNQIIDGLEKSKVTLFKATAQTDAGPILYKENISLCGNLQDVFYHIEHDTTSLLVKFFNNYPNIPETKQISLDTKKRRTPEMSEIKLEDFTNMTAKELYNKIRCLQNPYPNAFVSCKNNTILYFTGAKL